MTESKQAVFESTRDSLLSLSRPAKAFVHDLERSDRFYRLRTRCSLAGCRPVSRPALRPVARRRVGARCSGDSLAMRSLSLRGPLHRHGSHRLRRPLRCRLSDRWRSGLLVGRIADRFVSVGSGVQRNCTDLHSWQPVSGPRIFWSRATVCRHPSPSSSTAPATRARSLRPVCRPAASFTPSP